MRERSKRFRKTNQSNDFYYPPQRRRRRRERTPSPALNQPANQSDSDNVSLPPLNQNLDQVRLPSQARIEENPKMTTSVQTEPMTPMAKLNEMYTDPHFPSAYSADLKKFLKSKESLSRHKRIIKKFKRRKIFVHG